MVVTKELATKGAAILGSAGAGSTGLYYGGRYVSGLTQNAEALKEHTKKDRNNYVIFKVEKMDGANQWKGVDTTDNDIDFTKSNSFVVKVTSKSMDNVNQSNAEGHSQSISSQAALTCSFRFEVEGNPSTKTINQDY